MQENKGFLFICVRDRLNIFGNDKKNKIKKNLTQSLMSHFK